MNAALAILDCSDVALIGAFAFLFLVTTLAEQVSFGRAR